MIRVALAILAMLFLPNMVAGAPKAAPTAARTPTCVACHADFSKILPADHPAVPGKDLAACFGCHPSDASGKPEPNPFAARLHLAHGTQASVECTVCHTWKPGKSFGLPKSNVSFGAPTREDMKLARSVFTSWGTSTFLDAVHGKNNMTCSACHGQEFPTQGDRVENDRCLACHGPADQLAAKTRPADYPDRNPHQSHLGEISCGTCHKAHRASTVYCLGCHPKFKMAIRGGPSESQ